MQPCMVAGLGSMIDPTYSVSAKIRACSLFVCLEFESEFILYEYALLLYDSITVGLFLLLSSMEQELRMS